MLFSCSLPPVNSSAGQGTRAFGWGALTSVLFILAVGLWRPASGDDSSVLLDRMARQGVVLTEDVQATLPPPTFLNDQGELLQPAVAEEKLKTIAAPLGGVGRFLRDSIVAPISIRIQSIDNAAGKRIGHQLDFIFAVPEPIEKLRDSEQIRKMVGDAGADEEATEPATSGADSEAFDPTEDSRSRPLTEQQIDRYGLQTDPSRRSIRTLQFPLMDRVIIEGVVQTERSVWNEADPGSPVVFAWQLDPRFSPGADGSLVAGATSDGLANIWRGIERGDRGQKVVSEPSPYRGIGGYLAITPAPGQPEVSILQASLVLHEPQDWFAGRNQIRSKLPLIVQDRVRRLRRQIRNAP